MRPAALLLIITGCVRAAAPPVAFHVNYATYLGGAVDDLPTAIAVDGAGNSYVAGVTDSPDFPLTSTAFATPYANQGCVFVAKIDPSGSNLVWSICLAATTVTAIGVDRSGYVYVLSVGSAGPIITRLSPDASKIVYSNRLGVFPLGIAVDSAGDVYAAGSAGPGLTTTPGAYQTSVAPGTCYGGGAFPDVTAGPCPDAFVLKLNSDGSLAYATYLGGSGSDQANAIAVDSQGNAWITGSTVSPNFPVTPYALQATFHGEIDFGPLRYGDAFAAKLDPNGAKLLYSTYLGGSAPDAGNAIVIDGADAAYVTGGTQSTDFPTTPGAFQRVYGGGSPMPSLAGDAFVSKFNASGAVAYSTYLGGPQDEEATIVQVDSNANAYVNAYPNTTTLNLRTLSELNADGSAILNTALVPGIFALDSQAALYLAASSLGYLFFPTAGAFAQNFGAGIYDATVVKIDFAQPASAWIGNIVNAASLSSGSSSYEPWVFDLAPGELVSVLGSGLDATTRLAFDGFPAPILSVQPDRILAAVPFAASGPLASIKLESSGQFPSTGIENLFDAVPGVFTADGSGTGQAAVLNQDGTPNSAANPAARGSVISIFLTGAGRMTPAQADGSVTSLTAPFPAPVLGVACSLGEVLYAGAAPGMVAGVIQVNVRIGGSVAPSNQAPFVVYIGNYVSGFNTTVAVK